MVSAAMRSVTDPSSNSYPIETICDGAHGPPLIPWPNRLVDGKYRFNDGHQLPTGTEPVDGTAYGFGESRLLGATTLDFAFSDLVGDADGRAWTASGGPIDEGSRSERRRATGSWSSTPATPWPHLVITPEEPLRLMR